MTTKDLQDEFDKQMAGTGINCASLREANITDGLVKALEPFARLAAINAPLNIPDSTAVRDIAPGLWPTMGDCRRALKAIQSAGSKIGI